MKISVFGTGYVGLVTGVCLADMGNDVLCVDTDKEKIKKLKNSKTTIFEPGLEPLLIRNKSEKRLNFTNNKNLGIEYGDIIFLCLPTPPNKNGSSDLSFVLKASKEIAQKIKNSKIVVLKSTVPVGTNKKVSNIFEKYSKHKINVISNPEFLKQGSAVQDFMSPDRIVIGSNDKESTEVMKQLYQPFMRLSDRFFVMDPKSAELTKYAANSFLATKISFMNEVSRLCDLVGANVDLVRKGIGVDNRIGNKFLFPGTGYGGSCFPKDVKALIHISKENKYDFKILNSVNAVNEIQKTVLVSKIKSHFKNNLKGKKFAIWGLSFKPKTDDLREAPSIEIINNLLKSKAIISVFDPVAIENTKKIFGNKLNYFKNQYSALKNADALIIVTEWNEFRNPNFEIIKKYLTNPLIFDGRNIFNPELLQNLGFKYYSVGRPTTKT